MRPSAQEESKGNSRPGSESSNELRMLVLADDRASFFKLAQGDTVLEQDPALPSYPRSKAARFAPLNGKQATVVDDLGVHFVSMETREETLFVAQPHIEALKYSPAD